MRRASSELALGARLAVTGRSSRARTLLTAAGLALGVAVLLIAAAVPHARSARAVREDARTPRVTAHGSLRLLETDTEFAGRSITGVTLQAAGSDPPVPPGLTRLPGPGEMVVSPALAGLLRGPDGGELRRRLDARVVGTIAGPGLAGPAEDRFYRGSALLARRGVTADVDGFGVTPPGGTDPVNVLLVIVIVVALLLPVGVFIGVAARFGAEERDRRLAAIRLVGADRIAVARIAVGETMLGTLAGLALGAGVFLAARPLASRVSIDGTSVFASDLVPSVPLVALVAVLVVLGALAASLVSIRRVAIEPLGVSRRGAGGRRRLAWRLAAPALGFALLVPLVDSEGSLARGSGQIEATAGVILVLCGLTALLPWLVEGLVRRAGGGPLPWLLAVRRLRADEGSAGRVVGAIGLAVAGAIALQVVFAAAQADSRVTVGPRTPGGALLVSVSSPDRAAARADLAALRAVPGVTGVRGGIAPRLPEDPRGATVSATVTLRPQDGAAADAARARLRDTAAALDPLAQVTAVGTPDHTFTVLRRVLVAGAVIVLAMIGASLLVAASEGVRERRRVLAVLDAVGTRRATIAWSILWQAAIPVTVGLALAVVLGIALGTMLAAIVHLTPSYDWGAVALMVGAGGAVIAAVTLLTLPTLSHAMRPGALRVE